MGAVLDEVARPDRVATLWPPSFGLMQFWRSFCPREVNGLGELPILKRIVKRHPLGARLGKDRGKPLCERLVRNLVRPKPEDAAGKKVCNLAALTPRLRALASHRN